jgi:hypothetical protein
MGSPYTTKDQLADFRGCEVGDAARLFVPLRRRPRRSPMAGGYGRCGVRHGRRLRFAFIKRRFGLEPSSMMLGLDQIPESLFPAVACSADRPLGPLDIAVIALVFSVGEQAMSRLFFAVGLRDRPY